MASVGRARRRLTAGGAVSRRPERRRPCRRGWGWLGSPQRRACRDRLSSRVAAAASMLASPHLSMPLRDIASLNHVWPRATTAEGPVALQPPHTRRLDCTHDAHTTCHHPTDHHPHHPGWAARHSPIPTARVGFWRHPQKDWRSGRSCREGDRNGGDGVSSPHPVHHRT